MQSLVSLIWITSLFALFLGLFSPEKVVFWKPITNRKRSDLWYYLGSCIACLSLMFLMPKANKENKNQYAKSNAANTQSIDSTELIDSSLIFFDSALTLYQNKKYEKAITLAQKAENRGIDRTKTQDLKADCKKAMNTHAQAEKPKKQPKRKIIGYCSVCRDGTISDAVGKGACSHHKGVASTKPVYEE